MPVITKVKKKFSSSQIVENWRGKWPPAVGGGGVISFPDASVVITVL